MKEFMTLDEAKMILSLSKDLDIDTIKRAYRRYAIITHPDKGGDAELFKKGKKAYDYLLQNLSTSEVNNFADPLNELDRLILSLSDIDKRYRFNADIYDWQNNVIDLYVLLKGIGNITNDWGYIFVAKPLRTHSAVIDSYVEGTGINRSTLEVLGGGIFTLDWRGRYPTYTTTMTTTSYKNLYGNVKSRFAIKTCLDNFVHDNCPWAKGEILFDLK